MLLMGRIVKRQDNPDKPMEDTTYLIGVSATNLGKDVGETIDLVALERLQEMKIPEWAASQFRQRFPEAGQGNEAIRRQLEFWHRKILPRVLKGRK